MRMTEPTIERRAHERFPLSLAGGVKLEDGREMPCEVRMASAGGMEATAATLPPVGSRVTLRFDDLGLVEAKVVRHAGDAFAAEFAGSPERTARLGKRVEWLSRMQAGGGVELRSGARIVPDKTDVRMTLGEAVHKCRIIDLSRTGAAIATEIRVAAGEVVVLGLRKARVVRHLAEGIAVEFAMPLPQSQFGHAIAL